MTYYPPPLHLSSFASLKVSNNYLLTDSGVCTVNIILRPCCIDRSSNSSKTLKIVNSNLGLTTALCVLEQDILLDLLLSI